MAGRSSAAFGIFSTRESVERAVAALRAEGFRNTDISILYPLGVGSSAEIAEHTKAPEGATAGAMTGAILGGALGWVAGICSLAIPGLGPLIAAGPVLAALAGASAGGAVGGIAGALVGLGIPEFEAKRFEGRVKNGGILLSVHSENPVRFKKSREVLLSMGASDVCATEDIDSDDTSDQPRYKTGA